MKPPTMKPVDDVQPVADVIQNVAELVRKCIADGDNVKIAKHFAAMNGAAHAAVMSRLDASEQACVRIAIIAAGNAAFMKSMDAAIKPQPKESTMKIITEWAVIVAAFLGIILAVYVVTNFVGKSPNVTEMVVMGDGSLCAITNRTSVQCQPGAQADMEVRK